MTIGSVQTATLPTLGGTFAPPSVAPAGYPGAAGPAAVAAAYDGSAAVGQPPLGARLLNAVRNAFRGLGFGGEPPMTTALPRTATLAVDPGSMGPSPRPMAPDRAAAGAGRPISVKSFRTYHSGRPAAPAPGAPAAMGVAGAGTLGMQRSGTPGMQGAQMQGPQMQGPQMQAVGALPPGTQMLPGGLVVPVAAGVQTGAGMTGMVNPAALQGLSPQMQQQLGLMPTGPTMQGMGSPYGWQAGPTGMYSPQGSQATQGRVPQVNATNQQGLAAGATGADQQVANRNAVDEDDSQRGVSSPWDVVSPWGGAPIDGTVSPVAPYGPSMTATPPAAQGGFFQRFLG